MLYLILFIQPGLFLGNWARSQGGGGMGVEVPMAYNSKTIHSIEMKFSMVVENHKINLVLFN